MPIHRLAVVVALACGALFGCGVPRSEYEQKAREVENLRAEVAKLQADLDDIRNGPPRLLAEAKAALDAGNFERARSVAQQLIAEHPGAAEAVEAREIDARTVASIEEAKLAAEEAKAAAAKARQAAMAGMSSNRDDMRGLTFWRDKQMPKHVNDKPWLGAYISQPDQGPPYLRFVVYYTGDDWLFIEGYLLKVDGKDFTFVPQAFGADAVERDNGYGGIWEWWDVLAEGERLAALQAVADSKDATLRCSGKQYYRDRKISDAERASLKRTLLALETLKAGG